MKHRALICLLLLTLFLMGCVRPGSGSEPADKGAANLADNAYLSSYLSARSGQFFYFTEESPVNGANRIYVYDSVSGEVFPLCAKPECTHKKGDCNAAIPSDLGNINLTVYGDRLYFLGESERKDDKRFLRVYSVGLDGSDRRISAKIEMGLMNSITAYLGIYDGTIYRLAYGEVVENGRSYMVGTLVSQPLDGDGESKELFRTEFQDGAFFGTLQPGKLWFCMYDSGGKMHLYLYDIDADRVDTVFEGMPPTYAFRMTALEDRLVFHETHPAFSYSLEDGTFTELANAEGLVRYGGDTMFAWTSLDVGRCFAEDGSVLQDGVLDSSLFKEENRPTRTYLGVIDGKYCFLVDIAKDDSDEEKHNYFLVYDSKTNTFSVPWDSDMK
ncbi:MAG: hypothetical protein II536_00445 [Clostridia bacterium]|nr:hypothetical protein [Clostridia bacterium]